MSVGEVGGRPSGTVTFLFTDIEGSTGMWELASAAMSEALERHDASDRGEIDRRGGRVFATGGDGFAAAFGRATDAVAAAVAAQEALASEPWPPGVTLRVRMGLHTGEALERGGDYFGPAVNRAARLMAVAHGGQVVCSAVTAGVVAPDLRLVDLGEHRLRDHSLPERVLQVGLDAFPQLRTPEVVPKNLPVALTEMIGREREVHELSAALASHRLVTLTGVGGVGKTRLLLAVAADTAAAFPDGCWFVDLSVVGSTASVAQAVANAVGAPVDDLHRLAAAMADRRALVVLDNCEHVIDAVADAVEVLLAAAADAVILATSREPLGVAGELVYRVRSLKTPAADAELAEAMESDAVRLVVDRARSAGAFEVHDGNVHSVVEICHRLDGIPLAIELAAQAAAMPLEESSDASTSASASSPPRRDGRRSAIGPSRPPCNGPMTC